MFNHISYYNTFIFYISDDIEDRLKRITITGFSILENELHFIPLPYISILKYILCDYEQNEDNAILTICKHFKDKYESFLKDNKYDMITRLTLPLFYVTLMKIDGRPLKELVYYTTFIFYVYLLLAVLKKFIFCSLLFNKKLVSFINDMCMKMFFALVNNTEKTIFSKNSKYNI